MPAPEFREYTISGETSPEVWSAVLGVLGGLGLSSQVFKNGEYPNSSSPAEGVASDRFPYGIGDILSRDQYLAEEHAEEFWPQYAEIMGNDVKRRLSKYGAVQALRHVLYPRPRKFGERLVYGGSVTYGKSLGLRLVRPRTLVGFPARSLSKHNAGQEVDSVVEVGSFLDFIDGSEGVHSRDLPDGLDAPARRFLAVLASQLSLQAIGIPE